MSKTRILKLIHLASTIWFVGCLGYIFVSALRQAGLKWWVIFSLSGHSALLVFLLISLYLFAIYRGIDRGQKIQIEHPLTSTGYYSVFYDTTPFLGAAAGYMGTAGIGSGSELPVGICLGTFVTTFFVWIVVDPVAGFFERLLPASRRHRNERLAAARAIRQKQHERQQQLLADVLAKEQANRRHWQQVLQPYAEKLAVLLSSYSVSNEQAESEALDIGAMAWQMGGLGCMRELHKMVMEMCTDKQRDFAINDYISSWWDGIGSWRAVSVV